MVTIGAFAIAILALWIFAICEYHNYWLDNTDASNGTAHSVEDSAASEQKLLTLTAQFEAQHQNVAGFKGKLGAIWRFVDFVLFKSQPQKLERCRRNELTADKLLAEYQTLVRLPGNERVDRFIRWRDDVADYQQRKG